MLCSACEKILPLLREVVPNELRQGPPRWTEHHQTYLELQESAEFGCHICRNIWYDFNGTNGTVNSQSGASPPATSFTLQGSASKNWFQIIVRLNAPKSAQSLRGKFYKFVLSPQDVLAPVAEGGLSNSTNSCQSWNQALRWHQVCSREHQICREIMESKSRYPTRLLDVGTGQLNRVHLIDTTKAPISGPYVTLSHCWGKVRPIRLMRSNLSQFMTNIDWFDLPLTFQHAVTFTRFLRVRYLWIDSLCIIQDEDWLDDWFYEASLMQEVYHGSFLNLAANSAMDCTGGLFRNRNARLEQPCYIHIPRDVSLLDGSEEYLLYDRLSWHFQVGQSPLARRGWYLQERLLAPRVLHFGSRQLFWECHQQRAAETFPQGLPKLMEGIVTSQFKAFHWSNISTQDVLDRIWPNIIAAYTAAQITNPGDKLIALSGVAKKLQSRIGGSYIAGLWEVDFIRQLCWMAAVPDDELGQRRPLAYRAPSFSWASLDAPVCICDQRGDVTKYAELILASHTPVTDDSYGAVRESCVLLRCILKPIKLIRKKRFDGLPHVEILLPDFSKSGGDAHLDSWDIDLEREDIYSAILSSCSSANDEEHTVFGLILQPYGSKGTFQRLGLFRYHLYGQDSETLRKILAPLPDAPNLPSEHYDSIDGKHTIRLI